MTASKQLPRKVIAKKLQNDCWSSLLHKADYSCRKKAFWEGGKKREKKDNGNKQPGQRILHPSMLRKTENKVTEAFGRLLINPFKSITELRGCFFYHLQFVTLNNCKRSLPWAETHQFYRNIKSRTKRTKSIWTYFQTTYSIALLNLIPPFWTQLHTPLFQMQLSLRIRHYSCKTISGSLPPTIGGKPQVKLTVSELCKFVLSEAPSSSSHPPTLGSGIGHQGVMIKRSSPRKATTHLVTPELAWNIQSHSSRQEILFLIHSFEIFLPQHLSRQNLMF